VPARTAAPPRVLATRVAAEVEAITTAGGSQDGTSPYLAAAEALFIRLLREGCSSRASAVDLLVVDALVTYAFELDQGVPAEIEARAERAMTRVGRLVA
jgi:hypothetical protein